MDADTLTFLLRGGHLSMPERIERGLWPHPPLRFSEVASHLTRILQSEKWFSREWHPYVEGGPVYEGGIIERKNNTKYIYRVARAWPTNPFALAEVTERVFANSAEAAAHSPKQSLFLPGDLDGSKVIE